MNSSSSKCLDCNSPPAPMRVRCLDCLRIASVQQKAFKLKRRKRGLCQCGKPLALKKKSCEECAAKHVGRVMRNSALRKEKGLCHSCGRVPIIGRKQCRKCLDYWNVRAKKHFRERRLRIISHYGGKCACCGIEDIEFLGIDHIHGGGRRKRAADKTVGSQLYNWIFKQGFPVDMFQILCHNCNCGRQLNGGVCPHKT